MTEFYFIKKLQIADAFCSSAADYLKTASSLLAKVKEHKIASRSAKASKSACLKEATDSKNANEQDSLRVLYKKEAKDLKKKANDEAHKAALTMFFHPQYTPQPFDNLLGFLQRLPSKQAAEVLKQIIAIVANAEIKTFLEDESEKIARGKKSLWAIGYFRLMEFVVKNALFCENIKINHKLNLSTNFLGFRVASLQYQGKMAQMRSIAFERLEMFQKRRHNLLNISAFLCFLFRKIFRFPGNFISTPMRSLLKK